VAWPSGKAEDCKSFIPSSILGAAFRKDNQRPGFLFGLKNFFLFQKFFVIIQFNRRQPMKWAPAHKVGQAKLAHFVGYFFESLVQLLKSGYGIVAITSVFQTEEMGSIPIIRWRCSNKVHPLYGPCGLLYEVQFYFRGGSMPEWLKGVDCKSTDESLHKFESYSAQRK
jgi:hypothetical protein